MIFGLPVLQLLGIVTIVVLSYYSPSDALCRRADSESGVNWVWCDSVKDSTVVPLTSKQEKIHGSKNQKVEEEKSVLRP